MNDVRPVPRWAEPPVTTHFLMRFLWLSVATALATVLIKGTAAALTGSVGLLSDALESTVNLIAAGVGLWALALSGKPADYNHDFGHGKAEYMASAVEGSLILLAAVAIIASAVQRLIVPQPIEQLGIGLILTLVATALNGAVGALLIRQGRKYRSIAIEADGHHLMADVITSIGVLAGVGLILITDWLWLDPLVAILVALNILVTGFKLIRRSVVGLLDAALPPEEVATIRAAMDGAIGDDRVSVTSLLTRESGRQRFAEATVSVPGHWTVSRSHALADDLEAAVGEALPQTRLVIHIEPRPGEDDPY